MSVVWAWPFFILVRTSGGIPHDAALSVAYFSIFSSAAENELNSAQASFGDALRALAARIASARFDAASRSLPNSWMQGGSCRGCDQGEGAACCRCAGADHGDGAACCGCCPGHGAVAGCCCGHGACAAAGPAVTANMQAAIDAARRKFMANPR